jgi:methionyl-tRNA formyltransferase
MTPARNPKQVLLIGNRGGALRALGDFSQLHLTRVLALADSPLDREFASLGCTARLTRFTLADRETVCALLAAENFDVLISNGCPFLLPVTSLRRGHQLYINLHPSLLPKLRGKLHREPSAGCTLHYMTDRADTGRIIYQQQFDVTPDIDLGLLYAMLFDLEVDVFRHGMRALIDAAFDLPGDEQSGLASHFSRRSDDMRVDFREMSDDEIVARVRAFGVASQGVTGRLSDRDVRIVEARSIVNPFLLAKYAGRAPATLLLSYEDRHLVKSREGVINIRMIEAQT